MTKSFTVSVTRTSHATVEFRVNIEGTDNPDGDLEFAKRKALEMAANHEFGSGQADYEATVTSEG